MRPDGCLTYKGRKDFTIKIRGYRVEFAEVEKALVAHTDIGEVVVAAPANESGEARLVAYFTSSYPGPSVTELRGFLKKSLPDYMIPSVFVRLDGLPLTPNGKVDRTALPPMSDTRPDIEERYLAPRTPTEQALADIWAALLKVDRVGVHDNFFDLGGHSLLATQALARIRDQIRVELPLRTLFEKPTIAGLALAIEALKLDEAQPEAIESVLDQLESLSDEEIEQQRLNLPVRSSQNRR
jgi:acyl carrier protein